MGQRACHAAKILFENVFVRETHVMGYEGDGMIPGLSELAWVVHEEGTSDESSCTSCNGCFAAIVHKKPLRCYQ